jgi:hypothetical protein
VLLLEPLGSPYSEVLLAVQSHGTSFTHTIRCPRHWTGGTEEVLGTLRCCLAVELQVIMGIEGDWTRINLSRRHEPSEHAEVG